MKYIDNDFCLCNNKTCDKRKNCLRYKASSFSKYQVQSNMERCPDLDYYNFVPADKYPEIIKEAKP